jgi:CAAX prenyl protease-like protein
VINVTDALLETASSHQQGPLPEGFLARWPWLTFLLPMIVYMAVGSLEPTPPLLPEPDALPEESVPGLASPSATDTPLTGSRVQGQAATPWPTAYDPEDPFAAEDRRVYLRYPWIYTAKIALTLVAMAIVFPGYRSFAWRVSPWSVVVGVIGVVLWIGLCRLDLEPMVLAPLGLADFFADLGQRSAFNPLWELRDQPRWAMTFLGIRFLGLALVVPIIEEFFLRGFLMRVVVHDRWEQVPFGTATVAALVVGTAVPMLMHPGELFAALVWFSLVSWLMVRTRNIWDCVVAHGVTNLLLGIYVVTVNTPQSWQLM